MVKYTNTKFEAMNEEFTFEPKPVERVHNSGIKANGRLAKAQAVKCGGVNKNIKKACAKNSTANVTKHNKLPAKMVVRKGSS